MVEWTEGKLTAFIPGLAVKGNAVGGSLTPRLPWRAHPHRFIRGRLRLCQPQAQPPGSPPAISDGGLEIHELMEQCLARQAPLEALKIFEESQAQGTTTKQTFQQAVAATVVTEGPQAALLLFDLMQEKNVAPNVDTVCMLLKACGKLDDGVERSQTLLRRLAGAKDAYESAIPLPQSIRVCKTLLQVLATAGAGRQALNVLENMVDDPSLSPDTECYNCTIKALRKAGLWREAFRLLGKQRFEKTQAVQRRTTIYNAPDATSYTETVLACIEGSEDPHDTEEAQAIAVETLKNMRDDKVVPPVGELTHVYQELIEHAIATGRRARAMETFAMMRQTCPRISGSIYRGLIHIIAKAGGKNAWKQAYALLEECRDNKRRLTVVSYNTVISLLGRAGQVEKAYEVFREMRQGGVNPTASSYNQLLVACDLTNDWRKSLSLLEEMQRDGLKPDCYTYCSVINSCGKGGQWEQALKLLLTMRTASQETDAIPPNLFVWNAALHAVALAGKSHRVEQLAEMMLEDGLTLDTYSFNALILAYTRGGRAEEALAVGWTMREGGIAYDEHTYGGLIAACAAVGDHETAIELLEEMETSPFPPNVHCYTAAMTVCAASKQPDLCSSLLERMVKNKITPNVQAYTAVISGYQRAKHLPNALGVLRDMKEARVQPDVVTYTLLISTCEKANKWEKAIELLRSMVKDGVQPNCFTYTAAMAACVKCEKHDLALTLFYEMEGKGIEPDLKAFSMAISAAEKSSRWQDALSLLSEMKPKTVVKGAAKGDKWLPEEDERLVAAVAELGDALWVRIAERVGSRTNKMCAHRWNKVLKPAGFTAGGPQTKIAHPEVDPEAKHGADVGWSWSAEEEAVLTELVSSSSDVKNWGNIARRLPGRTTRACREHWEKIKSSAGATAGEALGVSDGSEGSWAGSDPMAVAKSDDATGVEGLNNGATEESSDGADAGTGTGTGKVPMVIPEAAAGGDAGDAGAAGAGLVPKYVPSLKTVGVAAAASAVGTRKGVAAGSNGTSVGTVSGYTTQPPATSVPESVESEDAEPAAKPPVIRPWKPHEDRLLHVGVERYGLQSWRDVGRVVRSRSGTMCRRRWGEIGDLPPPPAKVARPRGRPRIHPRPGEELVPTTAPVPAEVVPPPKPWTQAEDDMLLELVEAGLERWHDASAALPGRTLEMCLDRWNKTVDPELKKGPWTAREDRTILSMQARLVGRWGQIVHLLAGRTEDGVERRYKVLRLAARLR